jgi:hypothetical protein
MKINLNIEETERKRILEMHENAIKNNNLNEQESVSPNLQSQLGIPTLTTNELLNKFIAFGPSAEFIERIKYLGSKGWPNAEQFVNNPAMGQKITNAVSEALRNIQSKIPSRFYDPTTKQLTQLGTSHIFPIPDQGDVLDTISLAQPGANTQQVFKDIVFKVANDQLQKI